MSLVKYLVKSLKEICFDYITKPWSKEEITSWSECSLFCLPFKIREQIKTSTFYYCTCQSFVCKEKCANPEHERLLYVKTVKLVEIVAEWKEIINCMVYNCDTCTFEDNLEEICTQLKDINVGKFYNYITLWLNLLLFIATGDLTNQIKKVMIYFTII